MSGKSADRQEPSESRDAGVYNERVFERAFEGVVVVADVSGYTRFTEELVKSSPDGIERVGRVLERSFRRYTAIVSAHGGRIASLAGDAVIAYWPSDAGEASRVAARAAACARQLVRSSEPHALSLHAGVASGAIWAGSCAGFEREQDTVIGGFATRQAFRALRAARAGEVAALGSVLRLLGDSHCDPAGIAQLPAAALGDLDPDAPATLPPLDGVELWNAELRHVAVLFLRFPGFSEHGRDQWQRYRDVLMLAQETLGTSGATGRLVIDDTGLVFVTVFGEPGAARLDAPDVITSRVAGLMERLRRWHVPVAAGLAFGRVFCGDVRYGLERWRVSVGRALNIAARLMDQAESGLLVADYPLDLELAGLAATEPLSLRGIDDPVQVSRYEPSLPHVHEVRLFGRDDELARIDAMIRTAQRGGSATCLVRADGGMGKTALLDAVQARAAAVDIAVVRSEAQPAERGAAYFLWRRVLRDLLPEDVTRERAAVNQQLLRYFESIGLEPSLIPLLNAVFHIGVAETPASERITGKARSEATLELVFSIVSHAARRPTLFLFEDVHFADPASIELLERTSLQLSNVAVIATARPSAATSELIYRLSGPRYHQLDLRPLTREGIAALLRHHLRGPISLQLLEQIEEASRGNALFALEYLRLLRDQRRIIDDSGVFALNPSFGAGEAPETVISTVSTRIHALPAREQIVLKIASVLGTSFTRAMLQKTAATYADAEIEDSLVNLEQSGLVVRQSLRDDAIGFSHALIRDAAYDAMLFEQKRRVHGDVARLLEERRDHQTRSLLPAIVHHAAQAGDHSRVIKYGELAAVDALTQGNYADATSFLKLCLTASERALRYVDGSAPVRWHRWLAEAAGATGALHARREHALCALRLAGEPLIRSRFAARLRTLLALLRRVLAGRPQLRRWRGVLPRASKPHVDLAHACHELAFSSYFAGDGDWFAYYSLRALAHAERGGDLPQLIETMGLAGACMSYIGLERTGRAYMNAATELSAAQVFEQARASSDMHCALYFVGAGGWTEVLHYVNDCQRTCQELGSNYLWGNAQIIRFWLHWYRGERELASQAASRLLAAAERSGNRQHLRWAHRSLGLVRRSERALGQARHHLDFAERLLAADSDLNEVVQVLGSAAELALASGEPERAEPIAVRMLERLGAAPRLTGHAMLEGCAGIMRVVLHAWEERPPDLARKARAHGALRVLQRYARVFPIGEPHYQYWRARWLRANGKRRAAAAALRRARAASRRLRVVYNLIAEPNLRPGAVAPSSD